MTTPTDRESVGPLYVKHPVDGIIRRLDEHYDVQSDVEQDPCGAWFAIQDLCAALDVAEAKLAKAIEAGVYVAASLNAAISLLERGGKKAAPSDKMFAQMLVDYSASLDRFRATLAELTGGQKDE